MEIGQNLSQDVWESFADQGKALLQQRWAYGEAARVHGRSVARLDISSGDRIIAIAQVLHRPILGLGVSTSLAGPIWLGGVSAQQKQDSLLALSRKHPFRGPLILMPATGEDRARHKITRIMTPTTLALLPLGEAGVMRAAMRQKWRNRLVTAERQGLQVKEERGPPERIAQLLSHEGAQRKTRRYRGIPLPFLKTLSQMGPAQMRLFSAYEAKSLCAMMLFLQHGSTASYLVGWSNDSGRRAHAHNLLMWRAMTALAGRNIAQIDLGALDTENAPGLARFKLGTGAIATPMGGAWCKIMPQISVRSKPAVRWSPDTA